MKYSRENTEKLLQDFLEKKILVKGIVSNMKGNYPYSKVILKPLLIKNNFFFQFEQFQNNKAYHSNLNMGESTAKMTELLDNFKQFMMFTTEGDYQILKGKNDFTVKVTKKQERLLHLSIIKQKIIFLKRELQFLF